MLISAIQIQNFRAIHEAYIVFHPYTLLVGANNAGKSTLVDCLRAFLGHDKYAFKTSRDFPKQPDRAGMESFAEITYYLSDAERETLPRQYQLNENQLRVKKWFSNAPVGRDAGTIYGYETTGELSTNSIFGAANVQKGRLGNVIYIPAVSKVDDHTKLSGPSALRDAIDELLKAVVGDSPAYREFTDQFSTFVEAIRSAGTADGRSLDGFATSLSEKLSGWGAGFGLVFKPPVAQEITKHLVDWQITDEDGSEVEHGIEQFGSGFQRHLIASLIRTRAEFRTAATPERRTFSPNLNLLLFEEPEAYLHPPQQIELARDLRTITQQPGWQVIASTHSPHFVSRNTRDLQSLVRLRNDNRVAKSYQLDDLAVAQIFSARDEIERIMGHWNELDEADRAELERVRYFLWLDNERCSLFFCDFVLLVEGPTEAALFSRLVDDARIALPTCACAILHSDGKYNTVRFMRLLNRLGLPFVVIHDRDSMTRQQNFNELIQNEATVCSFCRDVVVVEPNLEASLNWPTPPRARNSLKPGMILLNYETRGDNTPQLTELCVRVSEAANGRG